MRWSVHRPVYSLTPPTPICVLMCFFVQNYVLMLIHSGKRVSLLLYGTVQDTVLLVVTLVYAWFKLQS